MRKMRLRGGNIMLKNRIDRKILKICTYAGLTALITFGLGIALYHSGPFWSKSWKIFTAVMKPVLAGIVIAYLLMPLTNFIDRRLSHSKEFSAHASRTRGVSVLLTMAILFLVLALIILLIFGTVNKTIRNIDFEQIRQLGSQITEQYSELIDSITKFLADKGITIGSLAPAALGIVNKAADFIKVLFFGLIFSIYFLYDGVRIGTYWKTTASLLFSEKIRARGRLLLKDADTAFSGYIRGQLIDALLVGVLVSIAMLIAQMPYALLIGFLTGFGNLIPYMGPLFGYGTVIITSLISGNVMEHPAKLIIGLVILAVIQTVDGNVINPRLLSNQIEVHPLFVIACIIAGGSLGGFLGMLLAVPVGALIKTEFERYLAQKKQRKESAADASEGSST